MRDIQSDMVTLTLKWFREQNVPEADLWQGLGCLESDLTSHEGCSWEHFSLFLDRLDSLFERSELTGGVANEFVALPNYPRIKRMMRLAASPVAFYRLLAVLGPRGTPCIRGTVSHLPSGQVQMQLTLVRAGKVPNEVYFAITADVFRRLPKVLQGLDGTRLKWEMTESGATYLITPPRSRSLWARVRRSTQVLFGQTPMLDLLESSNENSLDAFDALDEQRSTLDQQIETRTKELAHLNHELRQANENKSEHLASMSHELRTPLNAIIGYTELLHEEAEDLGASALLPDLDRVKTSARHLLSLLNNILDLSKIESGHLDLLVEPIDVDVLLSDLSATVRPLVGSNTLLFPDPTGLQIDNDSLRLKQILLNLIGNALKFTDHGTVSVTVDSTADAMGIHITDTGIGMSTEELDRLFVPYRQANVNTQKTFGGTGLGLAIARELARLMGGDVTATSSPGTGSTFTVVLPTS